MQLSRLVWILAVMCLTLNVVVVTQSRAGSQAEASTVVPAAVAGAAIVPVALQPEPPPVRPGALNVLHLPQNDDPDAVELPDGRIRVYYQAGHEIRSVVGDGKGVFAEEPGMRFQGRMPTVLRLADGSWRMYYTPRDGAGVYSAVSKDGLTFTAEPGVRLQRGSAGSADQGGMIHMTVVAKPNGGFLMYYDAVGDMAVPPPERWTTMCAESADGLQWTKVDDFDMGMAHLRASNPDVEMAWSPEVERTPDGYLMYFSLQTAKDATSGVWTARSTDGIHFRIDTTPLLTSTHHGETRFTAQGPLGVPQDPTVAGGYIFYWLVGQGVFTEQLPRQGGLTISAH